MNQAPSIKNNQLKSEKDTPSWDRERTPEELRKFVAAKLARLATVSLES